MNNPIVYGLLLFVILTVLCIFTLPARANPQSDENIFRIGMIGLDTSHVVAFTRQINDPKNNYGCRVVAAFKGGSPDVESSASRVDKFTSDLKNDYGVEIVPTIAELCTKVDGIMLESVDGRPHLKQAIPVIKAGLPLFIDKPMAGSLEDVLLIFELAEKAKVPCWSASSLRYALGIEDVKKSGQVGNILGCEAHSPCSLEPHHPDLYWYGVHGVETLFTVMGPGCKSVTRVTSDGCDFVVGKWEDGRIGTFRGIRNGKSGYGARIYGSKAIVQCDKYAGYGNLVEEIVSFFKNPEARVPVPSAETIEIFAFMTAADKSKQAGGIPISIDNVIAEAKKKNAQRK